MKTHNLFLIVLSLISTQALAQFSTSYPSNNSLRGYDILVNDGKYFYTCGEADARIIFEVDPSNGDILTVNADMGNYISTGATNGTGKHSNALMIHSNGNPANNSFIAPATVNVYPDPSRPSFDVRKVDFGSGSFSHSALLHYEHAKASPGDWNNRFDTYSDQATYDSDADGIEDFYFFTGTQKYGLGSGASTSRKATPFIMRKDKSGAEKFRYIPELYNHEEVPSKIVVDDLGNSFVAYGSYVTHGGTYVNSSTYRDAGIVALGTNMWPHYSKTYHLGSTMQPSTLGVAQSLILDGSSNLVFVASGDNALDPSTNSTGDWKKRYFHVVRTDKLTGTVSLAKWIQVLDDDFASFRVQVSDIVSKGTGYIVTGTATRQVETDIDLNVLFVMELDASFNEVKTKKVYFTDSNPYMLEHLRANKLQIIGSDLFITGWYQTKAAVGMNVPFLVKMSLDLDHECAIDISAHIHTATIYERHRPTSPDPAVLSYTLTPRGNLTPQEVEQGLAHQGACEPDVDPEGDGGPGVMGAPNEALGIHSNESSMENLEFFPNPANDQITISGMSDGNAIIVIMDIKGQTIVEYTGNVSSSHNMNISSLDNGVYFLQVTQGEQKRSMKLIKN